MISAWNQVMLWIVVNGGKWVEVIGAMAWVIVMLQAEYKLYVCGAGSPRLTWIKIKAC